MESCTFRCTESYCKNKRIIRIISFLSLEHTFSISTYPDRHKSKLSFYSIHQMPPTDILMTPLSLSHTHTHTHTPIHAQPIIRSRTRTTRSPLSLSFILNLCTYLIREGFSVLTHPHGFRPSLSLYIPIYVFFANS